MRGVVGKPGYGGMRAVLTLAVVVLGGPAAQAQAQAQVQLPPLVAANALGAGWQVANLPEQKPPATRCARASCSLRPTRATSGSVKVHHGTTE